MSARIAIAGGGPTGLMMGRLLAQDGHDVTVFEAEAETGGLCRSRTVDGFVFDLAGGHIMFTKDAQVQQFWEGLFDDEPLVVTERRTRLQRIGGETADDEAVLHHVGGAGECRLGRLGVASGAIY